MTLTLYRDFKQIETVVGLYAQEAGTADSTLESYRFAIERFHKGALANFETDDERPVVEIAIDYQGEFLEGILAQSRQHSWYTLKLYRNAIKYLWRALLFLGDDQQRLYEQAIEYLDVMFKVWLADIEVEALSVDDERRLRDYLSMLSKKPKRSFVEVRNALMVRLALYRGVRLEEVRAIRLSYITKKRSTYAFALHREHGKDREVHFYHYEIAHDVEWLQAFFGAGGEDPLLFVTKQGRVLSNFEIKNALAGVFKKAGVPLESYRRLGMRLLRHTFGVRLAQRGRSADAIARRMGIVARKGVYAYIAYASQLEETGATDGSGTIPETTRSSKGAA